MKLEKDKHDDMLPWALFQYKDAVLSYLTSKGNSIYVEGKMAGRTSFLLHGVGHAG